MDNGYSALEDCVFVSEVFEELFPMLQCDEDVIILATCSFYHE